MNVDRFEEIKVGDQAEIRHTIVAADVDAFAKLTGDYNPLHMDDDYAAATSAKKRVVHGMLTASFLSTIIGTKIPGEGALWYEQQLRFLSPVRLGETIRVCAKVKQKSVAQRLLVLETVVYGAGDRKVIEGEAKVKVLKPEIKETKLPQLETVVYGAGDRKVIEGEAKVKVLKPEIKETKLPQSQSRGAIIISGASRGIGAAIARELAAQGHPVVLNYVREDAMAEQVAREIREQKMEAIAIKAAIEDREAVCRMVDSVVKKFGRIDGIVNNASPPIESLEFSQLAWEHIQKHLDVQLKGAFNLTQSALPHLLEKQDGVIVNIGSICSDNVPPAKWMPYCLAKAALVSFTRSLAVEYGPKGIRVNCVSPGMTETDLILNVSEKAKLVTKMQTPLRQLAEPRDIAGIVAFLFTDKARHVTGETIRVCGGFVMA